MSTSVLPSKAAGTAVKAASKAEKYPSFHLPIPKRVHVPKHVKTADLRMRISLKNKPKDFAREHLVITTSRSPRDALPLEKLGEWDPIPRMRRLLPDDANRVEDLSFAGRQAVRFERRIELSTDKIRWWLEKGGAKPTKSVIRMLEHCGILVRGEHPFSHKPKERDVTQLKPSGHWPEYEPATPARTPGAILRGTTYVLPEGEARVRVPDIQAKTDAAAAELESRLAAQRAAAAEATARKASRRADKIVINAENLAFGRERVIDQYRNKVAEMWELARAEDAEHARAQAEGKEAQAAAQATRADASAAAAKAVDTPVEVAKTEATEGEAAAPASEVAPEAARKEESSAEASATPAPEEK